MQAADDAALSLDKETLKDLDAPSGTGVAGALGERETAMCPTVTCITCYICTLTLAKG